MKKFFYLASCSTCQRIMNELNPEDKGYALREIKSQPISPEELDAMAALSGSFESLFSRKAMKYRSMGLHERQLSEQDYRRLILEEYTFLKRPVLVNDSAIFAGNSKAVVEAASRAI